MEKDPNKSSQLAKSRKKAHKKLLTNIARNKKRGELDAEFTELDSEVFEEMDCLDCANCCKTTSPIFIDRDIQRISKYLNIKPATFTTEYLRLDSEGDYVLQSSPCAFLEEDNTCAIYSVRPRACREYPHTNRKNMHQILSLTRRNAEVCPAVYEIIERLNQRFPGGR